MPDLLVGPEPPTQGWIAQRRPVVVAIGAFAAVVVALVLLGVWGPFNPRVTLATRFTPNDASVAEAGGTVVVSVDRRAPVELISIEAVRSPWGDRATIEGAPAVIGVEVAGTGERLELGVTGELRSPLTLEGGSSVELVLTMDMPACEPARPMDEWGYRVRVRSIGGRELEQTIPALSHSYTQVNGFPVVYGWCVGGGGA